MMDSPGVIVDLPRRQMIKVTNPDTELPQMRFVTFPVNDLLAFKRFLEALRLLWFFAANTLLDALLGRRSAARSAGHLRHAFERAGGSFIKLGIHLSMRVDLVPWTYSNELACMADRMEPFPVEQAIAIIERTTKKPLAASFQVFDPHPISSSSVAIASIRTSCASAGRVATS